MKKKIKRLRMTNVRKLDEYTTTFELKEEETTTKQILEEHHKAIEDLINKRALKLTGYTIIEMQQ